MCIVVVDDEPELLALLSGVLEDQGYRVLSFTHPDSVMDLKETEQRVDVFLIDIMLPGMDGISLAAHLKDNGFQATRMIAMSASPHMIQASRESELFHSTLAKPFDLQELLDCIEHSAMARGATPV